MTSTVFFPRGAVEVDAENVEAGVKNGPLLSGFGQGASGCTAGKGAQVKPCCNCPGTGHTMPAPPKLQSKPKGGKNALTNAKKKQLGFKPRKPKQKVAPEDEPAAVAAPEVSAAPEEASTEPGPYCF